MVEFKLMSREGAIEYFFSIIVNIHCHFVQLRKIQALVVLFYYLFNVILLEMFIHIKLIVTYSI